jgi:hypothetical protein
MILSIDPVDEGLYQCLARNDYGEIINTFYLHIRPKTMLAHAPQNPKCFPMDRGDILVTYDKEQFEKKLYYFVDPDSPNDFSNSFALNTTLTSFVIKGKEFTSSQPFKPFYLFMRNIMTNGNSFTSLSELSKPVQCAMQGIEPKFVKAENGIFLRWDPPYSKFNITSYTVQFRLNGSTKDVVFEHELVGTYEVFPTHVNWDSIKPKLEKFAVKSSNNSQWSEVKIPGNVTGLYIVNTDEINVRVLGTVQEDGELFEQDLKYLSWINIQASDFNLEPLEVSEIESRSVVVSWGRGMNITKCTEVCSFLKSEIISRDSVDKTHCEIM